jgi:hypothetical protein
MSCGLLEISEDLMTMICQDLAWAFAMLNEMHQFPTSHGFVTNFIVFVDEKSIACWNSIDQEIEHFSDFYQWGKVLL